MFTLANPSSPIATEVPARWIVALTGASGMGVARVVVQTLAEANIEIHAVVSDAACRVMAEEEDWNVNPRSPCAEDLLGRAYDKITFYSNKDIGASIASGSMLCKGMVVLPCSMGTLGSLAAGLSDNLIHRAADVTLKEGRPLIIVPRETPLSTIHLENMLRLARAGARIVPMMPGFYTRPKSVAEVINLMAVKVLDQMQVPSKLIKRWGAEEA